MAKQIKAVKCPHCGSSQQKLIKEDFYKCDNCSTEYYLDSDDVNINVNHRFPSRPADNSRNIIIGVIIFLIFISFFVVKGCVSMLTRSSYTPPISTYKEKEYYASQYLNFPTVINDEPYLVVFSERDYRGSGNESQNGCYYSFVNINTGEIDKSERIVTIKELDKYSYRKSANGKEYVILNERCLLELNTDGKDFKDVTKSMFDGDSIYQSGLASIKFAYHQEGEGFNVMTNLGKEYYYFPLVNKTYTSKNYYDQRKGFKTLLPGARDSIYFSFSQKSTDREIEKDPLLWKITYKYNAGGPEDKSTTPRWNIIYDNNNKRVPILFNKEKDRIVDTEDITADRFFSNPNVVYYDKKYLLICYQVTAAKDSPINLQLLNPENGNVVWTTSVEEQIGDYTAYAQRAIVHKNTFIIKYKHNSYVIIDVDGKNMKVFEIPKST